MRAQKTCQHILDAVGQSGLETIRDQALNERDYGDLSGLNKDDARAKWGEDQVHVWRRSYDVPPPGGESLKDTGARVWPYYLHDMQKHVLRGGTVLVAAHGNSLRALIMALDGLTGEEIVGAGTRHRRADHLPAQRRFDRGDEGRAGLTLRRRIVFDAASRNAALTQGHGPLRSAAHLPRWRNW